MCLDATIGVLLAHIALLVFSPVVNASVAYTYDSEYSQYSVAASTSVTVNLYLQEYLAANSTSVINANGGLLGAGVSVLRQSPLPTSPAALTNFSFDLADFNSQYNSVDQSLSASGVQFSEVISNPYQPGVFLDNTGDGVANGYSNRIFIGSVAVQAGSVANQTTQFVVWLDDAAGVGGYTLTQAGSYDLDISRPQPSYTGAQSEGATTFSVLTVPAPEPSGALLFAAVAGASRLLIRRPRHQLTHATTETWR